MKKEKRNKGITLIALIVTIIVLLILAAVALNTLMGENGILSKASGAKDKTNYAQAKEDIDLAITETQARVIADENRNANLKDVVETLKNNSTYEYDVFLQSQKIASLGSKTNFADFTESTTTIYVIHHAYNDVEIKVEMDASGKISTSIVDGSGSSDSNEEDEVQYVETSADEISKDPQQNYGKEVCYGVDLDGDETTNDWIIFYSEGQNIFITPKKYLPSSFISGNKTLLKDDDDKYNVIWNSSKQTGLQSIKEETRTLFKSTGYILNSNYKSSRFSSMLLNTDNWQNLVDTDSGAIYAIGSPTIEMWAASWNKLNSSIKVYLSNSTTSHETGYFMSNVAGDITKNNGNTIVMVNNEVFFPALDDEDSSENYFLSSPISSTWFSTMPDGGTSTSIGGDGNIMFDVKHDSSTKYLTHRDVSMSGKLRPIVCISGKDGDSAKVQVKAVCKINETGEKYSSIEAAIAECNKETAQTITLFEDIKKDTITIGADKKVNLNLNGKNITSTIENNGSLIISGEGNITASQNPTISLSEGSSLEIKGGTINNENKNRTPTIYGTSSSTVNVSGGKISGSLPMILGNSDVTISGGNIEGNELTTAFIITKSLNITGGNFKATVNDAPLLSGQEVIISGGKFDFTNNSNPPVINTTGGKNRLELSNVEIEVGGMFFSGGEVVMNNSKIISNTSNAPVFVGNTITINDSTIENNGTQMVLNISGNINCNNSTIIGNCPSVPVVYGTGSASKFTMTSGLVKNKASNPTEPTIRAGTIDIQGGTCEPPIQ